MASYEIQDLMTKPLLSYIFTFVLSVYLYYHFKIQLYCQVTRLVQEKCVTVPSPLTQLVPTFKFGANLCKWRTLLEEGRADGSSRQAQVLSHHTHCSPHLQAGKAYILCSVVSSACSLYAEAYLSSLFEADIVISLYNLL